MKLFFDKYDPRRRTILCLSSHQFNRDVHMLQHLGTHFNWVAISDKKLIDAQPWVPERLRIQAQYVNEEGPAADAIWAQSRDLGRRILNDVRTAMPTLAAVMAGNWDYWNEECFRLACREEGLPFLVLMREHHLTPNPAPHQALYRKAKTVPKVDAIAVAGQATQDFVNSMKLQPAEILRNTGFPRLDVWGVPVEAGFDRPVVLFSYFKGYGADTHFIEMMRRFDDVARRHPAVPFLVKAKHRPEISMIEETMPDRSANLKIVDSLALPQLIKTARAVVGFRSLTLYEALLEGAPILVPYWGETAMDPSLLAPGPGDPRLKGYINFFSTPEALDAALEDAILHDRRVADLSGHQALFAQYFEYSPVQTATARVEQWAADVLAVWAKRPPPLSSHAVVGRGIPDESFKATPST